MLINLFQNFCIYLERKALIIEVLQPVVEYVKPSNQLQLGAPELEEDFARSLNAARPGPPRVILRYSTESCGP